MFLSIGKSSAFLLLLIWLTICSSGASAQNKKPETFFSAALERSPIDSAKIAAPSDNLRFGKTTNLLDAFQKKNENEKGIRAANDDAENVEDDNETSNARLETKINNFAYHFPAIGARPRQIEFINLSEIEKKQFSLKSFSANVYPLDDTQKLASPEDAANGKTEGFRWRAATGQTLMFLAIQHGYAFTQPKTREAIKGKFWKDYVKSVKSLGGWADGGRFFTNYIAHPMQGAFLGYIQVQNDPKGLKQQFGASGDYWRSRLKAMAWSAAWSTQFEIGPISQASIGNVGLKGKQTYIDIVVTPTVGTAWLIGEDAVDRLVMKRIERATDNFYIRIFSRMLLSPTRTIANVFRFKPPWHRDRPLAH